MFCILYLIFHAFKENPKGSLIVLSFLLPIFVPAIIGALIMNAGEEYEVLGTFIASSGILILLPLTIVITCVKDNKKNKVKRNEQLLTEITCLMKQAGYNLQDKYINALVTDITSPLYGKKLRVSMKECYEWISLKRENELLQMEQETFENILRIPLDSIPLNSTKCKNDAIIQRKHLAVKEILEREGLSFSYRLKPWMNDTSNYPENFRKYIREYNKQHQTPTNGKHDKTPLH